MRVKCDAQVVDVADAVVRAATESASGATHDKHSIGYATGLSSDDVGCLKEMIAESENSPGGEARPEGVVYASVRAIDALSRALAAQEAAGVDTPRLSSLVVGAEFDRLTPAAGPPHPPRSASSRDAEAWKARMARLRARAEAREYRSMIGDISRSKLEAQRHDKFADYKQQLGAGGSAFLGLVAGTACGYYLGRTLDPEGNTVSHRPLVRHLLTRHSRRTSCGRTAGATSLQPWICALAFGIITLLVEVVLLMLRIAGSDSPSARRLPAYTPPPEARSSGTQGVALKTGQPQVARGEEPLDGLPSQAGFVRRRR